MQRAYINGRGGATNNETKHKQRFLESGNKALAVLIWDAELCKGVPARVRLSSGLRAVDHCVENICSSNKRVEETEWSMRGLRFLLPALLRWKEMDGKGGRCSMMAHLLHDVHVGGSHGSDMPFPCLNLRDFLVPKANQQISHNTVFF